MTIDDVTFVTHGYILNVIIYIFLIFNILVATIVTLGFALNSPVKHFLLETSTIKTFIRNLNLQLIFNPLTNLELLFKLLFNDLTAKSSKKNPENFINRKNYDVDEIQKMKTEANSLSLFHVNSCSFIKNLIPWIFT